MTSGVRHVTFHPVEHTAEVSDYGQLDLAYQAGGVGSSDPSATLGSPSVCCRAPTNVWPLSSAGLRSKPSRQNSIRCIEVLTRRPDGHETVHRLRLSMPRLRLPASSSPGCPRPRWSKSSSGLSGVRRRVNAPAGRTQQSQILSALSGSTVGMSLSGGLSP